MLNEKLDEEIMLEIELYLRLVNIFGILFGNFNQNNYFYYMKIYMYLN